MGDVLIFIGLFVGITILAILYLAARDVFLHRIRLERRPVEEHIAKIGNSAAFMAQQLQRILDQSTDQVEALAWIPLVVGYYRRLELLARAPDALVVEIQQLAEESLQHVRQNRLKGISVGVHASNLPLW